MQLLYIDRIFCRPYLESSDGCFPKSTSLAMRHIEINRCAAQAPSKGRSEGEKVQAQWSLRTLSFEGA